MNVSAFQQTFRGGKPDLLYRDDPSALYPQTWLVILLYIIQTFIEHFSNRT